MTHQSQITQGFKALSKLLPNLNHYPQAFRARKQVYSPTGLVCMFCEAEKKTKAAAFVYSFEMKQGMENSGTLCIF